MELVRISSYIATTTNAANPDIIYEYWSAVRKDEVELA
jgi:hypothetical protein